MHKLVVYLNKEIKKNLLDYLVLLTAGILFIVSLNIIKGQKTLGFLILVIFTSFYIIWGVLHHIFEDTLHLKTVIEYILIAFTIIFLLKMLILP